MTEQTSTRFSNREELEQLAEYKRFNFSAVLALLLGTASAAMLLHLYLWLLPCLAICFAALALANIRRNDDMGGFALAWAGITLSLLFTTWAGSSYYFERWAIYQESKAVANNWFELVFRGEDEIAHQAMLHPSMRQATGLSVDAYYALDEDARKDKEKLFGAPPISEILGLGEQAQAELIENVTQDVDLKYAQLIRQVYRITAPGIEPIEVIVAITRAYKDDLGRATWIVAEVTDAK